MNISKIKSYIVVGILFFIIVSCDKTQPDPKPQPFGKVTAQINGQEWNCKYYFYAYSNNMIRLLFEEYENNYRRNGLFIANLPKDVGSYNLNKYFFGDTTTIASISFSTTISDGDVMGNYYILDTALMTSKLNVSFYDPTTDELKGTFEAAFVRDYTFLKYDKSMADTLYFTNGFFHTKAKASGVELY